MATLNIKGKDGATKAVQLYADRSLFPDYSEGDTKGYIAIYDGTKTVYPFTSKNGYSDVNKIASYYDAAGAIHHIYDRISIRAVSPAVQGGGHCLQGDNVTERTFTASQYPNGVRMIVVAKSGVDGEDGGDGWYNAYTHGAGSAGSGGPWPRGHRVGFYADNEANKVFAYAAGGFSGGGGGGGGLGVYDHATKTCEVGKGGKGGKGSKGGMLIIEVKFANKLVVGAASVNYLEYAGRAGQGGSSGIDAYDNSSLAGSILGGAGGHCGIYANEDQTFTNVPGIPATDINGQDGESVPEDVVSPVFVPTFNFDAVAYRGAADMYDKIAAKYDVDFNEPLLIIEPLEA